MTSLFVHRRLERLLAERAALETPLDDRCARLLERLRKECPEAIPPPKPEPGGLSDPVVVKAEEFQRLIRTALQDDTGEEPVLLVDGESELLVDPGRTRVLTGEGLVMVVLHVECDQTGAVEVTVPFAAGTQDATAGMILATEPAPRGHPAVTRRWGQALVAMAWEALLSVAAGLTRHAGADLDAAPLVPGALLAGKDGVVVVPQARHETDRLGRP